MLCCFNNQPSDSYCLQTCDFIRIRLDLRPTSKILDTWLKRQLSSSLYVCVSVCFLMHIWSMHPRIVFFCVCVCVCVCVFYYFQIIHVWERALYELQVCRFSPPAQHQLNLYQGLLCCVLSVLLCVLQCVQSHVPDTHTRTHTPLWVHSTLMKWKDDLQTNRWHHYQCDYVTEFGFPHPCWWLQTDSKQSASVFLEDVTANNNNRAAVNLPLFCPYQSKVYTSSQDGWWLLFCCLLLHLFCNLLTPFKVRSQGYAL